MVCSSQCSSIVTQTENSIVTQNRTGLEQHRLLDKIENLMLHKSDGSKTTLYIVQTAKSDDEQNRPDENKRTENLSTYKR
jgi:hypothetical protein